ncbi:DNA polymerase III subunit gamma/tau [Ferrimonas sediminicola]|uniref:DNA polymerase III subunit gamma/tau n=1 Tax=Ferrimonas sediminicola TaxID=2569538 RepID=A0A4U1BDF3_9GAMM|nr:DNA polymerase III subunit gamma/tau [Ferrimonas sediminicola]TKB49062.1 DNA polymerase III subunit gamma/tau [Ferrimonas sediminicola]
MAYQVLARKWRPASFDEVVGQQHVLKALTNALEQDRLHHAYLFTGTRGVGKTSIARLFAKGLNCEQGVTATPCGQCSACQEIAEGRFVDLMEIDAASRTKVDDTREILDNVQYQPVRGRYKVYLIDEVHMLSRHSFNALLKTLEEPPPHVKFLLATTDPQKLPVTVLSRCLQFNLKSLPAERIAEHLSRVLQAEAVSFVPEAVNLLARAAEGSVRDAMSLTDQAIAHGNGGLALAEVQAMLGTLDAGYSLKLLQALVAGDLQGVMATLEEIDQFSPDYDDLLKQLLELLHALAMTQFSVGAARLQEQGAALLPLASRLSREQVQLWYQMLAEGRRDLVLAPDPRSGLEMTLLRALAFSPVTEVPPLTPSLTDQPAALSPIAVAGQVPPESRPAMPAQAPMPQVGSGDPDVLAAEQQMLLSQAEQLRGAPVAEARVEPQQQPVAQEPKAEAGSSVEPAAEPAEPPVAESEPAPDAARPQSEPAEAQPASGPMSLMARALANRERLSQMGQVEEEDSKKPAPLVSAAPRGGKAASAKPQQAEPARSDQAEAAIETRDRPEFAQAEPAKEAAKPAPTQQAYAPESIPLEAYGEYAGPSQEETAAPYPDEVPAQPEPEPAGQRPRQPPQAPVPPPPANAQASPPQPAAPTSASEARPAGSGSVPSGNPEDLAWYQAIFDLGVAARARQLAINSLMQRQQDRVTLLLKPEQRHLMHDSVLGQIREKMVALWQQPIELKVEIGELPGRETPLEIRRRLHRERLAQAKVTLLEDPSVSWLMAEFDAQLIDESISYK